MSNVRPKEFGPVPAPGRKSPLVEFLELETLWELSTGKRLPPENSRPGTNCWLGPGRRQTPRKRNVRSRVMRDLAVNPFPSL